MSLWPVLRRAIFIPLGHLFLWIGQRRGAAEELHLDPDTLQQPLSDAELRLLHRWLQRHRPHEGWLDDLHALDGYLACVVVSPTPVPPGQWLDWAFKGELPADAPRIVPLMVRHMNAIAAQCQSRPARYKPLLQTRAGLGLKGQRAPLKAWCEGFMTATVLRDAQWQKLLRKEPALRHLVPIHAHADAQGQDRSVNAQLIEEAIAWLALRRAPR